MTELTFQDLKDFQSKEHYLLDTRRTTEFASGFIAGSIFLPVDKNFEKRFKSFFTRDIPLVIIASDQRKVNELESFFNSIKQPELKGFYLWNEKEIEFYSPRLNMIIEVEADEFLMDMRFDEKILPVDLRIWKEYEEEHLRKSKSLPLDELADIVQIAALEEQSNIYFYGEDGESSFIAASLLKKEGMENVRIVSGGWPAISHDPNFKKIRLSSRDKKDMR